MNKYRIEYNHAGTLGSIELYAQSEQQVIDIFAGYLTHGQRIIDVKLIEDSKDVDKLLH